jgi:hypothetical protein
MKNAVKKFPENERTHRFTVSFPSKKKILIEAAFRKIVNGYRGFLVRVDSKKPLTPEVRDALTDGITSGRTSAKQNATLKKFGVRGLEATMSAVEA